MAINLIVKTFRKEKKKIKTHVMIVKKTTTKSKKGTTEKALHR